MKDKFALKNYIVVFINNLSRKNYSNKSVNSYISDLYLMYVYFKKDLIYLNEDDVRDYIKHVSHNEKDSSVKRKISCLKTFYKIMIKEKLISEDPMKKIIAPKVGKSLPKFVYYNELLEIIDEANKGKDGIRNRLIIELLYATGVRVSELVNIKVNDIDFDNRKIVVLGKGNKERVVYFGDYAYDILKKYIKGYEIKDYLFINNKGKVMSDRSVRYIIDNIMNKLSINTHVTPHVLRHSFATDMLNNGCDIRIVQELLGHTSLKATEIYTHVTNERVKEVYYNCFPRRGENE